MGAQKTRKMALALTFSICECSNQSGVKAAFAHIFTKQVKKV
jgi:hypothetical protein